MVTAFPRAQTIVPVALITPPGLMMAETILRNGESEIAFSYAHKPVQMSARHISLGRQSSPGSTPVNEDRGSTDSVRKAGCGI
jgi:hypothetical protein